MNKDSDIDDLNFLAQEILKKWKKTGCNMNGNILHNITEETAREIEEKEALK